MVTYTIVIILFVLFFTIWIWLGIKQSAKDVDRIKKEIEKNSTETDPAEKN